MKKLILGLLFLFVLGCADTSVPDEEDAYTDAEYEETDEGVYEDEIIGTAAVVIGETNVDLSVDECFGIIGRGINDNLYSIMLNIDGLDTGSDEWGSVAVQGSNPENVFGATFSYAADSDEDGGWNTLMGRDEMASMDLFLEDERFAPVAGTPLGISSSQSMMIRVDMSDFMISRDNGNRSAAASFSYEGACSITIGEEE
ncbi:MAG: hypothetical protein AB8G77_07945 [Rhodothermales bacterium]